MKKFVRHIRQQHNEEVAQLFLEQWKALPEVERLDDTLKQRLRLHILSSVLSDQQRKRHRERVST